jgi:hypothetical protein
MLTSAITVSSTRHTPVFIGIFTTTTTTTTTITITITTK